MSFSWIPAACIDQFAACWLYITYGRTGVSESSYEVHEKERYAVVKLPDREFFVTHRKGVRPLDSNFDEVYYSGPYEPNSIVEQHTDFALISAHTALGTGIVDRSFQHNDLKIIVDSGGAQLKLGTSDYVDPYKAIATMNKIGDIGMSLDLPPRPIDFDNQAVYRELIKGTQQNNKIFFDHKSERLRLLNCIHGNRLEGVRQWAEATNDDRFSGWAAGTDNRGPISNVRTLMVPMLEYPSTQHYHQFGFSGKTCIPLIAWLGRHATTVTSDSSTWITVASKRIYLELKMGGGFKAAMVGEKNSDLRPNAVLPCSCPICHRIKYWQFFSLPPRCGSVSMLALHNFYVLANYANLWNHLAQQSPDLKVYSKHLTDMMSSSVATYLIKGCEYIEFAKEHGLDKAEVEFSRWLDNMPSVLGGMKSLFTNGQKKDKASATTLHLKGSAIHYARNYMPDKEIGEDEGDLALLDEVLESTADTG